MKRRLRELRRTRTGSVEQAEALVELAVAMVHRAGLERSPDGLDFLMEAIPLAYRATPDPIARVRLTSALVAVMGTVVDLTEDDSTLIAVAIGLARSIRTSMANPVETAEVALNLAALLTRRAVSAPTDDALSEAVDAAREAGRLGRDASEHHTAAALSALSFALRLRFDSRMEKADLLEAVRVGAEAVGLVPGGHPHQSSHAANWLAALGRLVQVDPMAVDIDTAVAEARAEIGNARPDDPILFKLRSALATLLSERSRLGTDVADLVASVRDHVAAARAAETELDRAMMWANACAVATDLANARRDDGDVDGARSAAADALSYGELGRVDIPQGDPRWAFGTLDLARAYVAAAATATDETQEDRHLEIACDLLSQLVENALAPTTHRLHAVRLLVAWAPGDPEISAGHYRPIALSTGVEMLSVLAFVGMSRSSQEQLLGDWGFLTADAVGFMAFHGRDADAVSMAERGRAVLWSGVLDLRSPLDSLDAALAAEVAAVRGVIESESGDGIGSEAGTDPRLRAAARWRELRREPAIARLLEPPDMATLRAGLGDETLVYLSVGNAGSGAVTVGRDSLEVISFDFLDPDEVRERAAAYAAMVASRDAISSSEFNSGLLELLAWLWDKIVSRVVMSLDVANPWFPEDDTETRRHLMDRVIWCPIGPLALLPLHAAGHYDASGPVPGRNLLERTVSSYTATGRILLRDDPRADAEPRVPAVVEYGLDRAESASAADYGLAGEPERLAGTAATVPAVVDLLSRTESVHLACHGVQSLRAPSEAHLQLQGGPLRLTDLPAAARSGDFAFLAACSTSVGGDQLPDEAITLVNAFQYAGWRRVVGTLWTVGDYTTTVVTKDFYDRLGGVVGPGSPTAAMLRDSVLARCRRRSLHPELWAGFVHVGPGR